MNSAVNKQKEGVGDGLGTTELSHKKGVNVGVATQVAAQFHNALVAQSASGLEAPVLWQPTFQLKNKEGIVLGTVHVEYDGEIQTAGNGMRFRELKNLTIENPEGGWSIQLQDLVSRKLDELMIVVPDKAINEPNVHKKGLIRMAEPLTNVENLLYLLHELSHAEQVKDHDVEPAYNLYQDYTIYYPSSTPWLDAVMTDVPTAKATLESDPSFNEFYKTLKAMEREIEDIQNRRHELRKRKSEMRDQNPIASFYKGLKRGLGLEESIAPRDIIIDCDRELALLEERFLEAMSQMKQYCNKTSIRIRDLMQLPIYFCEWDANNRANAKVTVLKDTIGVDLEPLTDILDIAITHWVGRDIPYPQTIEDVINIYRTPSRTRAKLSAESYAKPVLCAESLPPVPASEVQ